MEQNKFDLIEIIRTLKTKSKTILLFTVLGLIASVVFVFLRKDVYTSQAKIMVKSFNYFDRNQMFGDQVYTVREVFARESEVDKALTVLESDDIMAFIKEDTKYKESKGLSDEKAFKAVKDNYKVKRTDNSDIEIKFTDENPEMALKAMKAALWKAEEVYMLYFDDYNRDITKEIEFKQVLLKDSITAINKQIAETRKTYNIYNALAPVRGTVVNSIPNISEANAEGIEQLQSLITIKDKLDQEQAKLASLKSQYNSFLNESKMHAFYRIGGPYLPSIPSNLPAYLVILASALAAFIFACLWVLVVRAFSRV